MPNLVMASISLRRVTHYVGRVNMAARRSSVDVDQLRYQTQQQKRSHRMCRAVIFAEPQEVSYDSQDIFLSL